MTKHALPSGCTKMPWGFISAHGGITANTSVSQRNARAELGEFAIYLLDKLGVNEDTLKLLAVEEDPVGALTKMQTQQGEVQ